MIPVKIKAEMYGEAIAMLLRHGGGFQTRFEDILIVNPQQRRMLDEAGFVETNGIQGKARKPRGKKARQA